MKSTLIDPEAIAEVLRLIDEYLVQGGNGFDETKLLVAREQLEQLL